MMSVFFIFLIVILVYSLLLILLLDKMNNYDLSPFECGFDPKDKSRLPFSLQFFLLMILFLIFDVELVLLLQFPFQVLIGLFKNRMYFFLFLFMLLVGVFEEWRRGILKWKS